MIRDIVSTEGAPTSSFYSQLTTLTYPNGKTVTNGYDNAGNVTAVTDWLGHTTNYAYDANSNISNEALANGVSTASTYDNSNHVSNISDAPTQHLNKPFATFAYTRNSDGQILTSVSSGMPGTQSQSYTYDPLNRLTSSASGSYSYDAAGNLTSQPSVASQEYNSSGQLCLSGSTSGSCSTVPTSDTGYSYSAAGQRSLTTPPGISSTTMSYNQTGELSSLNVAATTSTSDTLSGGGYQTLSLKTDGTVWAWGDNSYGDLGNGTTTNSSNPVQVTGLSSMTAVAGGGYHSVALKSDGTVWTWGDNAYGQLGNGSTTNSSTPVQVTGLTSVTAIAAGDSHTLALKSDGTVWAWGDNAQGQLGNGSTTNSSTPVLVSGLSNVVAIAGGAFHSVALKSDGTVWTWGDNAYGQLGNGSTTNRSTPVQVSGLTNVVQIANGDKYFGEALKSDGTVWTWGDNNHGELGNGNHTASSVPIKVSGLSNITEVSGGYEHSVVLKSDGTVWSWGENSQGDLGNGTTTDSSVPVQAQGIASAIAVSAGIYHSVALKSDGTVWAWGANQSGQLGNNSFNNSLIPASSQMTNVASPKSSATSTLQVTYSYDGEGLRMSKTINGTPESFAWSTVTPGGVPELLVDGNTNYVYGPDGLPLEQISSSGTVLYYLHDQLGSTSAITNSSGSVIASYAYNPFGTLAATSGSLPSGVTNPFGFAGAYSDAESGLLYLINRYYDPSTAQFVSVDSLVSMTGQAYSYVGDNPLNFVDPLGACIFCWSVIKSVTSTALTVISVVSSATSTIASAVAVGCAVLGQVECTLAAEAIVGGASVVGFAADIGNGAIAGHQDPVLLASDAIGTVTGGASKYVNLLGTVGKLSSGAAMAWNLALDHFGFALGFATSAVELGSAFQPCGS